MKRFHRRAMKCEKKYFLFLIIVSFSLNILAQPTITSFSPASGPVGTSVTISGTNFSGLATSNVVFFGGVRAAVTAATSTSLTVTVPTGTTYQPITVTVNRLTAYSSKPFIVTFPGAASQFTSQSFGKDIPVDTVNANRETTDYTIGDVNNDGKLDVVTIDRLNGTMSTYRNTTASGQVTFAKEVDSAAHQNPRSVALADIDGDGKLDVIVTNVDDSSVSIFRNLSLGNTILFAPKLDFSTAFQPSGIAVTDLDKDGKPDLVINTINSDGYFSVLRNTTNGPISFAPKIDIQSNDGSGSIQDISVGDLDGDGRADVAIPNWLLGAISVFRNTSSVGSISFSPKLDIPTGQFPDRVQIADLNDDGKPELAVGYYAVINYDVSVFRNTSTIGSISFAPSLDYHTGNSRNGIAINDLDGDGKPDMAVCGIFDSVLLFKNTSTNGGAISFAAISEFATAWNGPIYTGDFDNDGKPDISLWGGFFRAIIKKNRTTGPQITSFSPTSGAMGTTVTIKGFNFSGVTSVSFGGVPASSFIIVNPTTITAVVDTGETGDLVLASTTDSISMPGFVFTAPPVITSFSPASAGGGMLVTISGRHLSAATAVSFGGVPAMSYSVVNATTIKATVGFGASGNVSVTTLAGTASFPGFVFTGPTITSFAPTSGGVGTVVTIHGTNFTGTTSVSFGGIAATSFTVVNSTTITATVGAGASGDIKVISPTGFVTSPGFLYIAPTITSFTPTSGQSGTQITITGTNFTGTSAVSFGGTPALNFAIIDATTISAVVAAGSSGTVSVTTPFGTASLAGFIYTGPPTITSFSPASAGPGTTIIITGAHFTGTTSVSFGGIPALSFSVLSYDTIEAVVGMGSSGSVNVTTSFGTIAMAGFTFIPLPTISSFTPTSGPIGTVITINGQNFSPIPANNIVYFGAVRGLVNSATSTTLKVTVPAGTTYEPISVLVNTLTAYSKDPFVVTFPNNGHTGFGPASFATKDTLVIGSILRELTVSDFDTDGKPDVAVVDYGNLGVSVMRNTSSGGSLSFSPPTLLVNGFQDYGIFSKDIDGDGRADILSGGFTDGLTLFRNTSTSGNISFANGIRIKTGTTTLHSYVEDIDGDGKPDIVAANRFGVPISVLRNTSVNGIISFTKIELSFPGHSATIVTVKDVDGDHKPDIIAPENNSNAISIFRNTSTPGVVSFAEPVTLPTAQGVDGLAAGDIDGDGKIDIVSSSYDYNSCSIFHNTAVAGNISFTTDTFTPNIGSGYNVSFGDINGDGKPDMAIGAGPFANIYSNLSAAGTISFSTKTQYLTSGEAFNTAIVDVDADGRPDLVAQGAFDIIIFRSRIGDLGVTSFTPTSGSAGDSIRITGLGFTGATSVSFGGVPASSFSVNSPTSITAVVAAGASGSVSVTTDAGTATALGFIYGSPAPTITSFTPTNGATGATITITGTNFTGATAVSFGGTAATSFVVNSSTSITAVVNSGASGDVSVTTPEGTATKPGFIFNVVTAVGNVNGNVNELKIAPSPANNYLVVEHPSTNRSANLRFIDLFGRVMNTVSVNRNSTKTQVNTTGLAAGVYKIVWSNGQRSLVATAMILR